jgi:hypothetical protein
MMKVTQDTVSVTISEALDLGVAIRREDDGRTYSVTPIPAPLYTGLTFEEAAAKADELIGEVE